MSSFAQQPIDIADGSRNPFAVDEFVDNPKQRCACVLLLDTSGSMQGQPISELNAGLAAFK